MPKIIKTENGKIFVVFTDEEQAFKMRFLFGTVLRMGICCFGGYYNAYCY